MKADGIDDSAIGGNASAEGVDAEDGAVDGNCISGINLVLHNRLVETGFAKKKDYQIHIKVFFFCLWVFLFFFFIGLLFHMLTIISCMEFFKFVMINLLCFLIVNMTCENLLYTMKGISFKLSN